MTDFGHCHTARCPHCKTPFVVEEGILCDCMEYDEWCPVCDEYLHNDVIGRKWCDYGDLLELHEAPGLSTVPGPAGREARRKRGIQWTRSNVRKD